MRKLVIIRHVLLSLVAVLFVFPLYWMFTGAFKPQLSTWVIPPEWIPRQWILSNFANLFEKQSVLNWMWNSVFTGLCAVSIMVVICAMAGYGYAKKVFPGGRILFILVIAMMMMPRQVMLVPLYEMLVRWNWLDTYIGLIVPVAAYPFGVFLIRQFIRYIPDELISAARIDGAGELRIFLSVIVPLSAPALGALAIFAFMFVWDDYLWQLIVLQSDQMKTLPLGVAGLIYLEPGFINYGLAMAGGTLAVVPLILFFLVFQRSFINGITLGTEK